MTTWVRGPKPDGTEHGRWLKQIESTSETLALDTRAIHVFDREGDDYYLFHRVIAAGLRFVARADSNRVTVDENGVREKLRTVVTTFEHVVERTADLSRRKREGMPSKAKTFPARDPRTARLCVAAAPVALVRPCNYGSSKYPDRRELPRSLTVNVVRVWEPSPPEGCTPVEWILYTNEPIGTATEILDVVDHYRARSVIEEYFKALKTGCGFEARQLHDYEALVNVLAVSAPIACHVLRIRTVARATPDAPASTVATEDVNRGPPNPRSAAFARETKRPRCAPRRRRTRWPHQVRTRPRMAHALAWLPRARTPHARMGRRKITAG